MSAWRNKTDQGRIIEIGLALDRCLNDVNFSLNVDQLNQLEEMKTDIKILVQANQTWDQLKDHDTGKIRSILSQPEAFAFYDLFFGGATIVPIQTFVAGMVSTELPKHHITPSKGIEKQIALVADDNNDGLISIYELNDFFQKLIFATPTP